MLRSPKLESASVEQPPPPKLTSLADWAGPPDDSQLPGFSEQPPAPTPVDLLGLSPAALGGTCMLRKQTLMQILRAGLA